ncbi:hypothetical protein [Pseudomonas sp. DWP3-1-2]|uniref:hypothetical protein n=1 Tax=Pseudomonas sp. DWP3-1-2 TaxID=2804645 RepID=UPI003CEC214F
MNINSAVSISRVHSELQNTRNNAEKSALAAGKTGDVKASDTDAALETMETAAKIELYKYEEKPWKSDT